jgi:hypothetical protein
VLEGSLVHPTVVGVQVPPVPRGVA